MIVTKTPLRLSLFCGGSDLPAFYTREDGAALSFTINKFTYVCLHESTSPNVRVMFDSVQETADLSQIDHRITQAALRYANVDQGITVTSLSDITTRGSGLGSSSAFTVGLLLALLQTNTKFGKLYGKEFSTAPHKLAELACEIEINRSGYNIGKQDQYAAAYGGTNLFTFHADGSVRNVDHGIRPQTILELEKHLLLVHTGRPRQAEDMLAKQTRAFLSSDQKLTLVRKNRDRAFDAVIALLLNKVDQIGYLLHDSWMTKQSIVKEMSSPDIDAIYTRALEAGALGGKLIGAGGGGFFVFYVPLTVRDAVKSAIEEDSSCRCMDFSFFPCGSQVILRA